MQLTDPSFFILGLVMASAIADETTTYGGLLFSVSKLKNFGSDDYNPTISATSTMTNAINSITITTSNLIIPDAENTSIPSMTTQTGGKKAETSQRPTVFQTTPKPIDHFESTSASTTKDKGKTTARGGVDIGVIIFIMIIVVASGFALACYFARNRGRRYSVDFTSRPDETNIPLSTVEPELPADAVFQNGLQTFESAETAPEEPQEQEAQPEEQVEQKAEADKPVVDPSAESAVPTPSPDGSKDKPKEDVTEQSPPAPVQQSVEEKTDDEGAVSSKTSVESLKDVNENNSNNADCSHKRDLESRNIFWDIPLDCPV